MVEATEMSQPISPAALRLMGCSTVSRGFLQGVGYSDPTRVEDESGGAVQSEEPEGAVEADGDLPGSEGETRHATDHRREGGGRRGAEAACAERRGHCLCGGLDSKWFGTDTGKVPLRRVCRRAQTEQVVMVQQVVVGCDGKRNGGYAEYGLTVDTKDAGHRQAGAWSAVRQVIAGDHCPAVVECAHCGSQYLACACFGCSEVQVYVDAVGTDDLKLGEGAGCRVHDADPVQETGGSVQASQVHVAPWPRSGFHSARSEGPDPVGAEGQGAGQYQQSLVVHGDRHRVDLPLGAVGCPCVEVRLVTHGVAGEIPVCLSGQLVQPGRLDGQGAATPQSQGCAQAMRSPEHGKQISCGGCGTVRRDTECIGEFTPGGTCGPVGEKAEQRPHPGCGKYRAGVGQDRSPTHGKFIDGLDRAVTGHTCPSSTPDPRESRAGSADRRAN